MEKLYFYHNQDIELKIKIYDTKTIKNKDIKLFVSFDEDLVRQNNIYQYNLRKTQYQEINLRFTTKEHSKLVLPIRKCYKIELFYEGMQNTYIIEKEGLLLSKDKYFEYFIKERVLKEILHIKDNEINYYSGPNKPDIIVKGFDIEITHAENGKLSFEKVAKDILKYKKYLKEYPIKGLIIVHDARELNSQIYKVVESENNIWVLNYKEFERYFIKILNGEEKLNKNKCNGIEESPFRRLKNKTIEEEIDLSDNRNIFVEILNPQNHIPELIYIRDITPDDLIFLIILTYENRDKYKGREGYKKLLKNNTDYLFQNHEWEEKTKKGVIEREFWFRPLKHMEIIDVNYRITVHGEYLYELWERKEQDEYQDHIKYLFLKAPGIKELLEIFRIKNEILLKKGVINVQELYEQTLNDLIDKKYVKTKESGKRYLDSIRSWMKKFMIADYKKNEGLIIYENEIKRILEKKEKILKK